MPRPTHYTEEPSRLFTTPAPAFIRVHGGGFVTRDMLEGTLEELRHGLREAQHGALLIDLRAMAGYESACLPVARQFLREAHGLGVSRVGVVATSTVLRTASRVAAHTVVVDLRTFEQERAALQWLHPPSPPGSRVQATASPAAPAS